MVLCETIGFDGLAVGNCLRYFHSQNVRPEIFLSKDEQLEEENERLRKTVATLEEENMSLKIKLDKKQTGDCPNSEWKEPPAQDAEPPSKQPKLSVPENRLKCSICNKGFLNSHSLSVHKSSNHRRDSNGNYNVIMKTCQDCGKSVQGKSFSTHRKSKACLAAQEAKKCE